MSDLYAPNQQVVRADGSGPAEEGSGGTPGEPDTPTNGNGDGDELEGMTKDELLALAEQRGVDANQSMLKADIIEAIRST